MEGLGHVYGFLTESGVRDEEDLVGVYLPFQQLELTDQFVVDLEPARSVENHDVAAVLFGFFPSRARNGRDVLVLADGVAVGQGVELGAEAEDAVREAARIEALRRSKNSELEARRNGQASTASDAASGSGHTEAA